MAENAVEMTLREVLHWLVDAVAPRTIDQVIKRAEHPDTVRAAVDKGFNYTPPAEQLSGAEAAQLNELLAKQQRIAEAQREADRLAAEEQADVENVGLPGS